MISGFFSSVFAQVYTSYTSYPTTFCTQDAYVCPDGTTVGRTGSNCDFVCPSTRTYCSSNNTYLGCTHPSRNQSSYYYTSGCYTYYYNGLTRTTSISSYNCATTYTQPEYYTVDTAYTYPVTYSYLPGTQYYTYSYVNGSWVPNIGNVIGSGLQTIGRTINTFGTYLTNQNCYYSYFSGTYVCN